MNVYVGSPGQPTLNGSEIFVILFVTLGPINFVRPFVALTRGGADALVRKIALRASLLATTGVLLSAILGSMLLTKWHVSIGAIAMAGAAILFIVAMKSILELYAEKPPVDRGPPTMAISGSPLAFPDIATPYGIAVLIVLLTLSPASTGPILGLAVVVMAIDLLVMLFVKPILRILGLPLSLLTVVLALMQVALSIQFGLFAIRTILAQGA
jgi:small neutral amino acid transporter SnatA (MarC family)